MTPEQRVQRLHEALKNYMAAFGQALEAHGIPYDKQQQEADKDARAALSDAPARAKFWRLFTKD